jgi:hypothetical protein
MEVLPMIAFAYTSCAAPNFDQLHAQFLKILPRIETHAQIRFGYLRCPGRRADAVAETVAVAWKWFLRITEQGKDVNQFVMVLADFAVRHVHSGRRLCGQERSKDVLSPRAQRLNRFRVQTLPCSTQCPHSILYSQPHGQERVDPFKERLRENTQSPVPEQAAFRVDYPTWLARLSPRHRQIIEDMALDLGTQELAQLFEVTPGRISQMRREFHLNWRRFHGEEA